jgi:hypothetical protein
MVLSLGLDAPEHICETKAGETLSASANFVFVNLLSAITNEILFFTLSHPLSK